MGGCDEPGIGVVSAPGLRVIVTVRHSATAANAAQIISGRIDDPLSDEGRALALQAVGRCGQLCDAVVVASPLRRALETAAIMTGLDEALIVRDDRCVERDYGLLQGLDSEQVKRYADQVEYVEVGGIRHSLNPPGGETFDQLRLRATQFYEALRCRPEHTAIVFSHQTFLQQLHGLLLGLDTIPSLGLDIRTLQIDRFEIDQGLPAAHTLIDAGMQRFRSW